jgi:hypothetical protein
MTEITKSILKDGIKLARLKRSIGRDHAEPRPLYPSQAAEYLSEMKKELDDPSNTKIAKRLGVSKSIVSDLLNILKAPSKYRDVWGWGRYKGARLPWSQFRRVCDFYEQKVISEEEFGMLVNGALNDQIPTSVMEEIVYLKKKNPTKSFEDCCKEILNLIPEKIQSIIFIADLDSDIIKKIREQAHKESKSIEEIAESVLSKYLGAENLKGVLIKNDKHIKIALNELGRKKLDEIASKENKLMIDLIDHLFVRAGYGV